MQWLLMFLGSTLVLTALYLAVKTSKLTVAAFFAMLGIVSCFLSMHPNLTNAQFEAYGTKIKLEEKVESLSADVIGPINLQIEAIKKVVSEQDKYNKDVAVRLNSIEKASSSSNQVVAPKLKNEINANYASYSVLVFYNKDRVDDAAKIRQELSSEGFSASMIYSPLQETTIQPTPKAGDTVVVTSSRGQEVLDVVLLTTNRSLKPTENRASSQGPFGLRRGDVQIYLYGCEFAKCS